MKPQTTYRLIVFLQVCKAMILVAILLGVFLISQTAAGNQFNNRAGRTIFIHDGKWIDSDDNDVDDCEAGRFIRENYPKIKMTIVK